MIRLIADKLKFIGHRQRLNHSGLFLEVPPERIKSGLDGFE
jgi:hypothetical protein